MRFLLPVVMVLFVRSSAPYQTSLFLPQPQPDGIGSLLGDVVAAIAGAFPVKAHQTPFDELLRKLAIACLPCVQIAPGLFAV
jgi:hypothetical protein